VTASFFLLLFLPCHLATAAVFPAAASVHDGWSIS
jgi:hypothetical protein